MKSIIPKAPQKAAGQPQPAPRAKVLKWKPHRSNTMRGFFSLQLPSGLILHDCKLHQRNGKGWVSWASREYATANGGRGFSPQIGFASPEEHRKFQRIALAAVSRYLEEGGE